MNEKRFTEVEIRFNEFSVADNGSLMASYEVINTLNKQHEEIQEYEQLITELTDVKNKYKNENEQLKKTNQELYDDLQEKIGHLSLKSGIEKENWLAVRDGDITLRKEEVIGLLNELYEENNKIKTIILQKLKELEYDYERSAKAGMPTGSIIGEIYTFEEICKEMGWLDD